MSAQKITLGEITASKLMKTQNVIGVVEKYI